MAVRMASCRGRRVAATAAATAASVMAALAVSFVLGAPCAAASPVLLFGPTANLLNSSHKPDAARDSAQLLGLLSNPAEWEEVLAFVSGSGGALHIRQQVLGLLSTPQKVQLAQGLARNDVQLSLEAGGAMCGAGSGKTAGEATASLLDPFLQAGGKLSFLALESVFSRTHAGCPTQSHQQTASELAANAAAIATAVGPGTSFFLYDALPHYSVGSRWPANVPAYDLELGNILPMLKGAMDGQGVVLRGYWADCPRDYSVEYPNSSAPMPPGSGYEKIAAAVELVHGLGLQMGKTFNSQSGGQTSAQAFYTGTLADYQAASSVLPRGEYGLDYVMVETWYSYPTQYAPESTPYTTAYTARAVFRLANTTQHEGRHLSV